MAALKVGVREFRERIASFLESDTPVAVTRRGETLGVYVPTRRKRRKAAELSELKAAADRLAEALADVDEEELVAEFKQMRRRGKGATRKGVRNGPNTRFQRNRRSRAGTPRT
jgi:PHD/YefM family antitoxin component YafN of YafNO toxin-antitoxin module